MSNCPFCHHETHPHGPSICGFRGCECMTFPSDFEALRYGHIEHMQRPYDVTSGERSVLRRINRGRR